ncbi:50S ribosomal protein L25 [Candidatus Profftia tarda]|uniref:Large ribosomal subunit protein bL25 n=1 Tax=Candidatus Profftia tarda TaxID=1177216 RepID=A0A8E4F0V6_9ENTR|nr:50S ribosomal protein L25 [Candidatus Profftia tarda]CAD6511878.1 50S ribosomal protein L25 [Candidatus Profftia tarda]
MYTIEATTRKEQGKSSSRRLRTIGRLPAVIYGGKEEAISVSIEHDIIWNMQEKEDFYKKVISLIIDGKEHRVKIQAVQRHVFKRRLTHIDFFRCALPQ